MKKFSLHLKRNLIVPAKTTNKYIKGYEYGINIYME